MKKFTALLLALAMVFALAACGGGSTSTPGSASSAGGSATSSGDATPVTASGDPVEGGSITVFWQEFYNGYDPSIADNRNYALWFDRLWSPDWNSSRKEYQWDSEYITMDYMTGQIADTWSFDSEAMTLSVTIRDDVYFQEKTGDLAQYDVYGGRQLTAEDVAWSYQRLLGLDGVAKCESEQDWTSKLPMLESVEVVDDLNLIFHFNTGSETALNDFMIAGVCIGGVEWDTLSSDQKSDWHYACGTGPYMIVDYVADSYMTFAKNPNYYQTDADGNQLPYLDEIKLVCITDSANSVAQFISGSIDILGWGNDVISDSEKQQLRDSMPEGSFVEYSYVTNPCGIFLKQCYEPLADIRVRTAIQKAIDMETITTEYYGYDLSELQLFGVWSQSTDWSSVSDWDQELTDSFSYDPEAAKALLEEAGYGDGFEFTVTLFAMMDVDLYTLVAEQLAQVGITMNIETVPTPPEMQAIGMDKTDNRCIPGTVCLYSMNQASQSYLSYGNNNNGAFNDPEMDALFEALTSSQTLEEQVANAKAADEYVAQQHYTIQCGPCEKVNSYISSRIGGYSGERLWKNWNVTTILTNIWVNE